MFYSQFGEDKILFDIFKSKTSGVCVEVGANNGVDDSISLFFEEIGWKCILVEPNSSLCQEIRARRKAMIYEYAASNSTSTATLCVVEGDKRSHGLSTLTPNNDYYEKIKNHGFTSRAIQVNTITLDEILSNADINEGIDFISIDVEGHELEALEGLTLKKWKPTILLIEDNSEFESTIINEFLKKSGYIRFFRTGVNDWYAHRTNKHLINIRSKFSIAWIKFETKTRKQLRKTPLMKIGLYLRRIGIR